MKDLTQRIYAAEGGIHLYSALPTVLSPADIYRAKEDPQLLQAAINSNIYLITSRNRISIDPDNFSLEGNIMFGSFVVQRQDGIKLVPFKYEITPDRAGTHDAVKDVAVALNGTHLCVITSTRDNLINAHVVAAQAESTLTDTDRDLDILYIGQGIGRSKKRTAIDRLLGHSTLQRILAETLTRTPEKEILILLYRFEDGRLLISNGGDFNAPPSASEEEESAHMERLKNAKINRSAVVSLVEAALINYFKPYYNFLLKENDFRARHKIKVLRDLLAKDITGLIVEICTSNFRSRLRTLRQPPIDLNEIFPKHVLDGTNLKSDGDKSEWAEQLQVMAHTHHAQFALTNSNERDTFLHGTVWFGETERSPIM